MKQKYELDWQDFTEKDLDNCWVTVKVLTGAEFDEIEEVRKEVWRTTGRKSKNWSGQSFIQVFRGLGFNTNVRFWKFDPRTDKPCILRCTYLRDPNYWFTFIYNGGLVNNKWTLEEWKKTHPLYRITSMLQVWI